RQLVLAQLQGLPTNVLTLDSLAAAPALARPVTLEAPAEPIEVVHGYGAPIPIKVTRGEKEEAALAITALPLPGGLAVPNANIAEKATEGNATVNAAVETPLGPMTIALTAKGKVGGKEQVLAIPSVTINVVRPAEIQLAAP